MWRPKDDLFQASGQSTKISASASSSSSSSSLWLMKLPVELFLLLTDERRLLIDERLDPKDSADSRDATLELRRLLFPVSMSSLWRLLSLISASAL